MNYNLLKMDTKTFTQKLKERYENLKQEKEESKNTTLETPKTSVSGNSNIRDELSKVGLSNTLMGTKQVINNQNKILKENTMGKIIPIKQIILEFTADHIREHAGKYAAGTMLGLGAAAGYLAGDPEHGSDLLGKTSSHIGSGHVSPNEDTTTIKLQNGTSHNVNYKTGEGASLTDHLGKWVEDRGNTNYHHNVMDAVNSDPSFLTTGEKIGGAAALGATALGAGLMAHKRRINSNSTIKR